MLSAGNVRFVWSSWKRLDMWELVTILIEKLNDSNPKCSLVHVFIFKPV